jgi:hypothetical protein
MLEAVKSGDDRAYVISNAKIASDELLVAIR